MVNSCNYSGSMHAWPVTPISLHTFFVVSLANNRSQNFIDPAVFDEHLQKELIEINLIHMKLGNVLFI